MNDTDSPDKERLAGMIQQAEQLLDGGQIDAADRLCDEVLAASPLYNRAHVIKAKVMMPGLKYGQIINRVHWELNPETYVEIGVARGGTLCRAQADTRVVGIDPEPKIEKTIPSRAKIYPTTSDDFFARYDLFEELGSSRLALGFIDGLHIYEQALRDFINLERYSQPDTVILIHDCYPPTRLSAERDRAIAYWAGDVWRLIACLVQYRPDLQVSVIPTFPSGLGLVTSLDNQSTVLSDNYDEIVQATLARDYSEVEENRHQVLPPLDNDWDVIRSRISG